MLVRDAQGRWRPGPRLGELANAAPDVLLTAAEPMLTALRDATGESAQLYLRRADERRLRGRRRARQRAARHGAGRRGAADDGRLGRADPARLGAAGGGHAAAAPVQVHRPHPRPRSAAAAGPRAWPSARPAWRASPRPIRDRTGRVIAAISVSGPIERLGPAPRRPARDGRGAGRPTPLRPVACRTSSTFSWRERQCLNPPLLLRNRTTQASPRHPRHPRVRRPASARPPRVPRTSRRPATARPAPTARSDPGRPPHRRHRPRRLRPAPTGGGKGGCMSMVLGVFMVVAAMLGIATQL